MVTENDDSTKYTALVVLIAVVILVYVGSWIGIDCLIEKSGDRGTFGDKFGAVNALFSGLAFAGLIYTIKLQRKELGLQRKELEAQRGEFNQQNATLKLQRFESTFFNMLELQQQIVNNLSLEYLGNTHGRSGRQVANPQEDEVYKGRYVFKGVLLSTNLHEGLMQIINEKGMSGYSDFNTITMFDHYFRNLYTILKFIAETKVFDEESVRENGETPEDAKYKYATILRASLSRYELVMLYYNGLSEVGKKKLKPLLEKYCMLNNLNKHLLTISLESKNIIGLTKNHKYEKKKFEDVEYSGTDYEILLTDQFSDMGKYHFTAFAHTDEEKAYFTTLINQRVDKLALIKDSLIVYTDEETKYNKVFGKM